MRNFNFFGYVTFCGILFLIILYKVIYVPVTCDELPTVSFYSNFSFWEIMMYPDNIPNNHILNTLLTKCCIFIFGKEQWAIRIPNLLSFLIFSLGVFRILKLVLKQNSWFFLPAAIIFINPYLLDFFGLCRGYGISVALEIFSISYLISGYLQLKNKHIWISLLVSVLASYANFTLLVFWMANTILCWFYFFIKNNTELRKLIKPTGLIFIISAAYLALIMVPIQKIQSTDEFQYWTSKGFYNETVKSLIFDWTYDSNILSKININILSGTICLAIIINIIYFIRIVRKGKLKQSFHHPAFVTTALLFLPVLINIVQTKILATPNLNGRTALLFFPLVSSVFAIIFGLIPEFKKKWISNVLAIFIGVLLLANLTHRVSLTHVKEWYFDQNNLEVINYLKDKQKGKPISLKTSWFFHPSFTFYCETGKSPCIDLQPYDKNIDVTTSAEYYYIFSEDFKKLEPRFEVVYKFSSDRWLLKQKSN